MSKDKKTISTHHGREVTWHESAIRVATIIDGRIVTIQKRNPSISENNPDVLPYRVLVDFVFVEPGNGFRKTLKEAKDDGVALAIQKAAEVAEAKRKRKLQNFLKPTTIDRLGII